MSDGMGCWGVVPAAGIGTRMGAATPKQYLQLAGKTVLQWTLERLSVQPQINGLVVVLSPGDDRWNSMDVDFPIPVSRVDGGVERCHSVFNALLALSEYASPSDWVLVHDAARPCVRNSDIDRLIESIRHHAVGGLLASPVRDTMKRCDATGTILETVAREYLWHALTPQMFRLGPLRDALGAAIEKGFLVTDEASAVEHAGFAPRVVPGHSDNIKITRPEDLISAEFYLRQQGILA